MPIGILVGFPMSFKTYGAANLYGLHLAAGGILDS
jgi:hypothetical protein